MGITLDLKAGSSPGEFEGYGSVFYTLDKHGDIILPGAFKADLGEFLKSGFMGGVGHDHGKPAGKFVEAYEDNRGLYLRGQFSDVQQGHEARTLMIDRVVQKLSVGIDREKMETSQATPAQVRELWKKAGYQPTEDDVRRLGLYKKVRLIHRAPLKEVSPVTIPANDQAVILAVKSGPELDRAFARYVQNSRQIALNLATVQVKAGRVFSGRNEAKLRAMVEVMASVAQELENLLALVSQSPEIEDTPAEESLEQDETDETTDENALENDIQAQETRGAGGKSFNELETKRLKAQAEILLTLAEAI